MIRLIDYKDEITNWAGFAGVVTGGCAMYFKDLFPEFAGVCGGVALTCGGIVGYFTGKVK